jgi:hypothetical protein
MSHETVVLLDTLDNQCQHVLGILEGLSEEDLRRPMLPSGWACVDLVQHPALDVERFCSGASSQGSPDPTTGR